MARNTLLALALLLLFSLASAARRQPLAVADSALETPEVEAVEVESTEVPEGCEGVGEEECLMRRTLVAHTDYIYTQGAGKKHP